MLHRTALSKFSFPSERIDRAQRTPYKTVSTVCQGLHQSITTRIYGYRPGVFTGCIKHGHSFCDVTHWFLKRYFEGSQDT